MKHQPEDLPRLQALPLDEKIAMSSRLIQVWCDRFGGPDGAYAAFSGGKDSTVLLDLGRSLYPDLRAVFFNTGLEFPEIVSFVKTIDNVEVIRPKMTFRQVIEKWGYPAVSKKVAKAVCTINRCGTNCQTARYHLEGIRADGVKVGPRALLPHRWRHLIGHEVRISPKCCDELKKRPAAEYEKRTGRVPFIGTMAGESVQRMEQWVATGCNSFGLAKPSSKPLSFWTEADIWAYIRGANPSGKPIPYSPIYDMGYDRTGCVFCCFGVHMEYRNHGTHRFLIMERTHPKLHAFCMRPWDEGGLGIRRVLELMGLPWRNEQMGLFRR